MEKLLHLSFTFENIQYHDVKVLYVLKVRTKKYSADILGTLMPEGEKILGCLLKSMHNYSS